MKEDLFEKVKGLVASDDPTTVLGFLAEQFREEKNYPLLFEARLMQKRHELGLPLIPTRPLNGLTAEVQQAYDEGSIEAAREVGGLFLAAGEIDRAWPYFRAVGDSQVIAEAIDKVTPEDDVDRIIEIAFNEGVHPEKGFELILANHGICRAITCFGQYPTEKGREGSARLLVKTLHGELLQNLKRVVQEKEDAAPETKSIPALIADRDWLFEGNSYYLDTSHVCSVIQFGPELQDRETLERLVELTEYGKHLSELYQFQGEPPFENVYEDYGFYLRALLGENVEDAVAHFRAKLEGYNPEEVGSAPAQVLVRLLARLERYDEAAEVFEEYLADSDPTYLRCPTPLQLCQLAGNYERLESMARRKGDLLTFAASRLQRHPTAT
jgi:tetratricopeptide (TPR) repeat protein